MPAELRERASAWLRPRRDAPGLRHVLVALERGYEVLRAVAADQARPALGGGWPARLVPMPAPRPHGRRELRHLRRALRPRSASGAAGDTVTRFEEGLRSWWGCEHALAVSSGTAALHVALAAVGVGAGDEVVLPVLTHVSAALAVLRQGARPVFVDAHPGTWAVDAGRIEAAVTARTKAVLVMHPAGVPCDMGAVSEIARRRGLRVVEDAAQAHGSLFDGRKAGTCGDLGCLSFQDAKTMTTGEGGAVLTDDDALARRARLASDFGAQGEGAADLSASPQLCGWNYRMSAAQAALGLGQIERLERVCARRRRNAAHLRERLAGVQGLKLQGAPAAADPCPMTFCLELEGGGEPAGAGRTRRDEFLRALAAERVDYRLPTYAPLHTYPVFGARGSFPVAQRICASCVGLRVDPSLGLRDLDGALLAVRRALAWSSAR